jgi:hypothetical protein
MTRFMAFFISIFPSMNLCAQTADEVLKKVYSAQDEITTLSYTLVRSDTFVTGQTRIIKGQAKRKSSNWGHYHGFCILGKKG